MLGNIAEKGQKPGRLAAPQQRITVRTDGINRPPYILLIYLTVLSSKLLAMAMSDVQPDVQPDVDLSTYYDERVMAFMWVHIVGTLNRIVEMQDGEEEAEIPVSRNAAGFSNIRS